MYKIPLSYTYNYEHKVRFFDENKLDKKNMDTNVQIEDLSLKRPYTNISSYHKF